MNSSTILGRALVYGVILTGAIAVVGSVVGYLVAGAPGLWSALLGAGLTALFMGLTAGSIILAARLSKGEPLSVLFFGIVLGAWILKLIVFLVVVLLLRTAEFVQPVVLFFSILVAVIGSLAVDVLAFVRSREPYVQVELPSNPDAESASGDVR